MWHLKLSIFDASETIWLWHSTESVRHVCLYGILRRCAMKKAGRRKVALLTEFALLKESINGKVMLQFVFNMTLGHLYISKIWNCVDIAHGLCIFSKSMLPVGISYSRFTFNTILDRISPFFLECVQYFLELSKVC